ncbi:MAG: AEC family transporter [Clostridiales bacterium]|nr:AEC family transporter [Clostridiales bacterium]
MLGFNQVIALFMLILFGYLIKKFKMVTDNFQKEISVFVLNVALPAFIVTSVNLSFTEEMIANSGKLWVISAFMFLASLLISYILVKVLKIKGSNQDIYQFILIFPNVGYMGFPIIKAVYGDIGVFYAAIFNLNFNILLWSLGIYLLKRNCDGCIKNENTTFGKKIKASMNPALYALILGFGLSFLKIEMPSLLKETLIMVGNTTSPLSMMFIGFILTEVHLKELLGSFNLYLISLVRLLGLPAIFFLILRNFISGEMLGVSVLLFGMPAAVNTAVIASRYGSNYKLASKIVFLSTLMSIITIPLMINFFIA